MRSLWRHAHSRERSFSKTSISCVGPYELLSSSSTPSERTERGTIDFRKLVEKRTGQRFAPPPVEGS